MEDLSLRVTNRMQLTTDGHRAYLNAVSDTFGIDIDYAMIDKIYLSKVDGPQGKYSPGICIGARKIVIEGAPTWQKFRPRTSSARTLPCACRCAVSRASPMRSARSSTTTCTRWRSASFTTILPPAQEPARLTCHGGERDGSAVVDGGCHRADGYRSPAESMNKSTSAYATVLADLRAKRTKIDTAIGAIEELMGDGGSEVTSEPSGPYAGMSIHEAAKLVLRENGSPVGNADIAKALQEGGLSMKSADVVNTVGAVLTRRSKESSDLVKVGRGVWGLPEWNAPKAQIEQPSPRETTHRPQARSLQEAMREMASVSQTIYQGS